MTEKSINVIFAKNLRSLLEINGMTQKELAKRLSVGTSSVSSWCRGEKTPRMSRIDAICKIFNCTRVDLIEEANNPSLRRKTMRKFFTAEEFWHVKKGIEAEYFDKVYASKNSKEKVEMLFGRHCKVPNDFLQEKLKERGFLYDPLGDNVEQTLCCFDIYYVELPQDADLDRFISSIRKERDLRTLRWMAAVRADTAIDAIQKYAKVAGLTKDGDNPYLYNKRLIATVGKEKIAYFEKLAIFAK